MACSTARPVVKLKSTAGTGVTYVTRKNRLNDPDRLVLRKCDAHPASAAPGGGGREKGHP
ncbi:50S ribosomal protein L33 [Streptomyces cellulosae]